MSHSLAYGRLVGLLVLFGSPAAGPRPLQGQQRLVLHGATLIDGTGSAPILASRIVIEAGHFTCVSGPDGCPSRSGDREYPLDGKWLTPGLIDSHVHLPFRRAPQGIPRLQRLRFALGITTVRDAGAPSLTRAVLAARASAADGSRPTPRIVVSVRIVPGDATRLGVRLGAPLVQRLAEMGVDAIKIKEPFDGDLWREEIRAARKAGLPVFGHTWGGGPPPQVFTRAAIAAGINGLSHLQGIALASQPSGTDLTPPDSAADVWAWHKHLWLTAEPAVLDSLISEMVTQGVWLEPTLATEYYTGRPFGLPPEVSFLRRAPSLREILLRRGPPSGQAGPAYPEAWARQLAFVGEFIRRGGVVIAGSDAESPVLLHEEIRLIGLAAGSPMAGLVAATRNAAEALARTDLGSVEVGKLADAVIYPADPLGTPGAILRALAVIKGGTLYDADTLRAEFRGEYEVRVRDAWRGRVARGMKLLGGATLVAAVLLLAWKRRRPRGTRLPPA